MIKFKIKSTNSSTTTLLKLQKEKIHNYTVKAIKSFVQSKYPEEYRLRELHDDWHRCNLTRQKLYYYTKKYNTVSKLEKKKMKKLDGKKMNTLAAIELTKLDKTQIVAKAIELKTFRVSKFCLRAIKWFLKVYHPEYYAHFTKFDNFDQCSITRQNVQQWVKRHKKGLNEKIINFDVEANLKGG